AKSAPCSSMLTTRLVTCGDRSQPTRSDTRSRPRPEARADTPRTVSRHREARRPRHAGAHRGQYTGPVPAEATAPPHGRAYPVACAGRRLMQPDLRSHLALLERHGKLVRVPRPVDPGTELAALIIEAEQRRQAVLFEPVRGSAMPCVANVVGDRAMVGLGLGVPPEIAVATFLERSRRRIPPVVVDKAPAQEVVHTGEVVDLRRL